MAHQPIERRGSQTLRRPSLPLGDLPQDLLREDRHVLQSFPERRQVQADHIQAVEQVLAELAGGDQRLQVDLGGGQDSQVDGHGLRPRESLE